MLKARERKFTHPAITRAAAQRVSNDNRNAPPTTRGSRSTRAISLAALVGRRVSACRNTSTFPRAIRAASFSDEPRDASVRSTMAEAPAIAVVPSRLPPSTTMGSWAGRASTVSPTTAATIDASLNVGIRTEMRTGISLVFCLFCVLCVFSCDQRLRIPRLVILFRDDARDLGHDAVDFVDRVVEM